MKIQLIFNKFKLFSLFTTTKSSRKYYLTPELDKHLEEGGTVSITFCHPNFGEMLLAEKGSRYVSTVSVNENDSYSLTSPGFDSKR